MIYRAAVAALLLSTTVMVLHTRHELHRAQFRPHGHAMHAVRMVDVPPMVPRSEVPGISILNVTAGLPGADVARLVKLSLDEHIHAVDGVLASTAGEAMALIEAHAAALTPERPRIDLAIDGPSSERRVLILANYRPQLPPAE